MGTDLTTAANSLQEKIRERIKASFAELVPDEAWDALIKSELERLTTDTQKDQYGNPKFIPSPLRVMVREEIESRAKAHVKTALDQCPEIQSQGWDMNGEIPSTIVRQVVREMAPVLVEAAISSIVQQAVSRVRQEMSQF